MRRSLIVAAFASLAITSPAAATTLGSTSASTLNCVSDLFAWQTDESFTVPPGGGFITSLATTAPASAAAGKHMTLKVVRATGTSVTIVATTAPFVVAAGVNRIPVRIPVTGGEVLGLYTSDGASCAVSSGAGGAAHFVSPAGGDPAVGATMSSSPGESATLAVEATFEPDADHDGFGDETEDSCATDPAIHTGPCQIDLGLTQTVTPATIGVGDVAVATVTLKNGSTGPAAGVTLGATVTPGLQIVSTIPATGCVFVPALSCLLGSLAAGGSVVSGLVLKGITVGAQSVASEVTTSSTDPNAANNSTSSPITVEQRVAVRCVVPKLTGLTKAFARQLLTAVNCRLGKATAKKAKKGRKGTVIKQARKAKTVLPVGTKVNVTLKK
jgi:hypothetical protein